MSEVKTEQKEQKYGKYDRWEIENDVQTIIKAEQLKLDKDKMNYILPLLEQQKKALDNFNSVADILYRKDQ